ncbi:hypothetical protein Tco_1356371, partial [Tanacetum coccineum]
LNDGCTKALATPEQTATGKEISNPLTADSLLKTIREDEMLLKIKSQISSASTLVSTGRRVSIVSTGYVIVKSAYAKIVLAFLKKLICKVLGLQVPLLELNRFGILLDELGEGQDMRFSRVLLRSPRIIKVSPSIGMWMTFSSMILG